MSILKTIALSSFLGKPLFLDLGILALLLLLFTASISILNKKGIRYIPFKWHPRMARITIVFALAHALLAVSLFF